MLTSPSKGLPLQRHEGLFFEGTASRVSHELLIEEAALHLRLNGMPYTTTMRTPGHDFELAAGFCFTEGLLAGAPVQTCRYCTQETSAAASEFNVVTVETDGRAPVPTPRLTTTTSSCGLCGSASIDHRCSAHLPASTRTARRAHPTR